MTNQTIKNITLSMPTIDKHKQKGVVILPIKKWKKVEKENIELRSAVEAILAGELALQKKQTRPFRKFLKSEFPEYAKNF